VSPARPDAAAGRLGLAEAWRSVRFLQLLALAVLALLLMPLQLRFRPAGFILMALYLDAVVVALSEGRYRRIRWAFLAVGLLALGLRVTSMVSPEVATASYVASRLLVTALLGICVAAALEYVLRGAEVSVDRIFAAIVAYILAGLAFAAAYQAVAAIEPESFALPAPVGPGEPLERREVQLIYFSFVTIATLGYGDITPRLALAQMLAVLEAVLGQFYVAVVIAWLVSRYAAADRRRVG
jgi:hypothetical protein